MRRIEMIELHDHPRFPATLRNFVTDALEALWQFGNSYKPILGLLHEAITADGKRSIQVLDLCSGGGGPWLNLAYQLERDYDCPVEVCLTDKYPSYEAIRRIDDRSLRASGNPDAVQDARRRFKFIARSVDALDVPPTLPGFRTMFSSFHHFGLAQARHVLANAVASGRGIGIFEVARRGPMTMFVLCFTPFMVLLLTPGIRPFRWSRLLWTYLLPVVPFVIWFDGWVSCLRTYSMSDLEEMVQEVSERHSATPYFWQTGEARTGLLPVTYLIGYPAPQTRESKPNAETSEGHR